MELKLTERIVVSNDVVHGKPRIAGTRVMVWQILDMIAAGMTVEEIISEDYFPFLTREDVLACVNYAKLLVENNRIVFAT